MKTPGLIEIVVEELAPTSVAYLKFGGCVFADVYFDDTPHSCGEGVEGWTLAISDAELEWSLDGDSLLEAAENAIDVMADGISA